MLEAEVVVAGNICLDVTPVFPRRNARARAAETEGTPGTAAAPGAPVPAALALSTLAPAASFDSVIRPGSLVRLEGVDIHTGGAVANVGLALGIFGARASLRAKVGDDQFGSLVRDILSKTGADGDIVVASGEATSYTVVLAPPGLDRSFLHAPGANDSFRFRDIDMDRVRSARLFHFGYPTLMAGMYRDGGAELVETFRAVHETGTLTSLDLASVDPSSPAALEDWPAILQETLPYVDFFVPSVEELAFMIDKPIFERLGSGSLASLSIEGDVIPLAKRALSLGSKVVMIKLGERGLYVASAQGFEGWGERSAFIPAFVPARVLSATGAGDSAIAAFLASFLRGYSLERAATLAAAAGAACVEAFDALSGLRGLDELESKINSGWTRRPI